MAYELDWETASRDLTFAELCDLLAMLLEADSKTPFAEAVYYRTAKPPAFDGHNRAYVDTWKASQTVQDNADAAYRTAGMSANSYMESMTGFSAALINSLSGDTQKAADQADVAMRAISDNANTFGTDIEGYRQKSVSELRLTPQVRPRIRAV